MSSFYLSDSYKQISLQRIRQKYLKILFLNENLIPYYNITGEALSGNVSVSPESDLRRSCSISMVVKNNAQFQSVEGGKIWLNRYVQIYVGIHNIKSQSIEWMNQGIFLIDSPHWSYDATTNILDFSGVDMMANLTGDRNGVLGNRGKLVGAYVIEAGASIKDAIVSTLTTFTQFNKYNVQIPHPTPFTPYEIKIDPSGTVFDILSALRDINPNYEMFFDADGIFIFQPTPQSGTEDPVITDDIFVPNVLSENINADFSSIKNSIEVYGGAHTVNYYAEYAPQVQYNIFLLQIPSFDFSGTQQFENLSYIINFMIPPMNYDINGIYVQIINRNNETSEYFPVLNNSKDRSLAKIPAHNENLNILIEYSQIYDGTNYITFATTTTVISTALWDKKALSFSYGGSQANLYQFSNYDATIQYNMGNSLISGAKVYQCIRQPPAPGYPPTNTSYWKDVGFSNTRASQLPDYSLAKLYTVGESAIYNNVPYTATQNSTARPPTTNPTYWKPYAGSHFYIPLVGYDLSTIDISFDFMFTSSRGGHPCYGIGVKAQPFPPSVTNQWQTVKTTFSYPLSSLADLETAGFWINLDGNTVKMSIRNLSITGHSTTDINSRNVYYLGNNLTPYAIVEDTDPLSPFNINSGIGIIKKVFSGGEYDNIYSDDLALQRAEWELYTATRLQDSITLTTVPLYYMDPNLVVSYTLQDSTTPKKYLTREISTDLSVDGTQSIRLIRYYPYYPTT